MQFNAAKPFNSMVKYAQRYIVNIYMEKGILWIHWMLEIMREDSNQRIVQEKRAVQKKKKELPDIIWWSYFSSAETAQYFLSCKYFNINKNLLMFNDSHKNKSLQIPVN